MLHKLHIFIHRVKRLLNRAKRSIKNGIQCALKVGVQYQISRYLPLWSYQSSDAACNIPWFIWWAWSNPPIITVCCTSSRTEKVLHSTESKLSSQSGGHVTTAQTGWLPGYNWAKRYSSYSYGSFSAKLFLKVPCDYPHKTCLLAFWNFKCKV